MKGIEREGGPGPVVESKLMRMFLSSLRSRRLLDDALCDDDEKNDQMLMLSH